MKEYRGRLFSEAKIQICLFIVLLAGLTGCGSTAKKAEVTNSPEPSVSYEQGADFVGAVGAVDEEQASASVKGNYRQ